MHRTDRHRIRAALLTLCVVLCAAAGCSQAPLKRFKDATRIDAITNPGWWEFQQPFAAPFAQLKENRGATCQQPTTIEQVYAIISQYENGWVEYWGIQPQSPPVTLTFHKGSEWLGTLDVYESALGLVGNKIHRVPRDEAAQILQLICGCLQPGKSP